MNIPKFRFGLAVLTAVPFLSIHAEGVGCPSDVAHRREIARQLDDSATFERTVGTALKDEDPLVRRYALHALYEKDPKRAIRESRALLTDPSVAVRQVAKSMNRKDGLYRENVAKSLDPLYDHDIRTVKSVTVSKGGFSLDAELEAEQFVELRFGKPKSDLYVWLNGVYLGQFDADNESGHEFRLDATAETKAPGANVVEVKDAKGGKVECRCTAEVLK